MLLGAGLEGNISKCVFRETGYKECGALDRIGSEYGSVTGFYEHSFEHLDSTKARESC